MNAFLKPLNSAVASGFEVWFPCHLKLFKLFQMLLQHYIS